jgi:hypothetical protein
MIHSCCKTVTVTRRHTGDHKRVSYSLLLSIVEQVSNNTKSPVKSSVTMKFAYVATAALSLLSHSLAEASFLRDVAGTKEVKSRQAATEDALLAKAIPLDEYRATLRAQGYDIPVSRRLDDAGDDAAQNEDEEEEQEDENGDDAYAAYYGDANYSFSGYSLKYAKCQPVQRFSEESIQAGEYSPMIIDDIVILRLCPYRFCSTSRTFGCHYNYAEYAIGLTDYVRIMLLYKMDKTDQLCNWCDNCNANARRLDDAGDDAAQGDDATQGDDAAVQGDDDNNWWNYANGDDAANAENDECYNNMTYCFDEYGDSVCDDGDDDADGDDAYLGVEEYLDYLDCVNVKDDQNYNYYVQPRCDGEEQTIKMGIFYDQFCSHYAGNQATLQDLGLGFREGYFEDMYSTSSCLDCSESVSSLYRYLFFCYGCGQESDILFQSQNFAPNFDANSHLCNSVHVAGAKCTNNLQNNAFEDNESSSEANSECSFIESVRYGTYDEDGQLYTESSFFGTDRSITDGQKWGLALSLGFCGLLAIYSCYLHHSITNLLIKSLSHTDLLPPYRARRSSRDNNRGKRSSGQRERQSSERQSSGRGRRKRLTDEDDDWDAPGVTA